MHRPESSTGSSGGPAVAGTAATGRTAGVGHWHAAPLLVAVLLLPAPGGAAASGLVSLFGIFGVGDIVYDPINHMETAVSAAQALRQTELQLRAEIQRLQQLAIEIRQLEALPRDTVQAALADWNGQLGVLQAAAGQLAALDRLVEDDRQRTAGQLRQLAALGLSPQSWLQREVAASTRRRQSADTLFAAERGSLAALDRTRQSLGLLQQQIPASSGIQQSLQTANQYLDLLAGQTSQLLSLGAAQAAATAQQRSTQESDASLAGAREAERTQRDLDDIAALRAHLRQQEASRGWGILPPLPGVSATPSTAAAPGTSAAGGPGLP